MCSDSKSWSQREGGGGCVFPKRHKAKRKTPHGFICFVCVGVWNISNLHRFLSGVRLWLSTVGGAQSVCKAFLGYFWALYIRRQILTHTREHLEAPNQANVCVCFWTVRWNWSTWRKPTQAQGKHVNTTQKDLSGTQTHILLLRSCPTQKNSFNVTVPLKITSFNVTEMVKLVILLHFNGTITFQMFHIYGKI